jgi:hypothetical protein
MNTPATIDAGSFATGRNPWLVEKFPLDLDPSEVRRYLGNKAGQGLKSDTRFDDLLATSLQSAWQWLAPKGIFLLAAGSDLGGWPLFAHLERMAFAVCTIGPALEMEVTRLAGAGQTLQAVVLDAIGSVAAEATADAVEQQIAAEVSGQDLRISCRVSPGYGDWDIRSQAALFSLVPAGRIGVRLSETCMMIPRKSVSFALHVAREPARLRGESSCADCSQHHCPYGREPREKREGKGE